MQGIRRNMASSGLLWEQAECFWWLSARSDLPSTAKIHFGRQVRVYYCFSWYPRSLDELLWYLYYLSRSHATLWRQKHRTQGFLRRTKPRSRVLCIHFTTSRPHSKANINVQGWRNIFFAIVVNRSADRRRTFLRSWLWMHAVIKLWSRRGAKRKSNDLFTRREGYPSTRIFLLFHATFIRKIGLPWS